MTQHQKHRILINSINYISMFYLDVNYVNSASEFISIYYRNNKELSILAKKRNYISIAKILNEYPIIRVDEVDNYIKQKRGDVSISSILSGDFCSQIFNFFGSKRSLLEESFEDKLHKIKLLNDKMIKIIENPS